MAVMLKSPLVIETDADLIASAAKMPAIASNATRMGRSS